MIETKKCILCEIEKPISEFHKDRISKDKLHCYCKECMKKRNEKYYKENKEKRIQYQKKRRKLNKERLLQQEKEYRSKNRRKKEAQRKVLLSIKTKQLIKPEKCQFPNCINTTNLEAHHNNYNEALEIIWLCNHHHKTVHSWYKILEIKL